MKNKKMFLWLAGGFALLLAIYLWVTMYSPEVDNGTVPEITKTYSVFSTDEDVLSVKLENAHGTFTFINSDAVYFLEENNTIVLDQSTLASLFAHCKTISSTVAALENADDLSVYGLSSPVSTVTITTESGENVIFVGDNLSGNTGYYFMMQDSPEVYVMNSAKGDLFTSGMDTFRNMSIISMSSDSITKLEITNNGEKLALEKLIDEENEAYQWIITSFMNKPADAEYVTEKLLSSVSGILATGIAAENPSDYSEYNLNIHVTVWSGDASYSFYGGVGDTNTYARIDGLPTVYTVNTGTFAFADTQVFDILERYAFLVYLDDIDGVDLSLPSGDYSMKVMRKGGKETYTINGKVTATDPFRQTYQAIVGISVDGLITDADTQNPVATISFRYSDGHDMNLAFYDYDNLNYAVTENGKCMYYMKKQNLDDIEKAFAAL